MTRPSLTLLPGLTSQRQTKSHVLQDRLTGATPQEIPNVLAGSGFLSAADQIKTLGQPTAKALADTSAFLKEQGRIDEVLPDYAGYTTSKYVEAAASQAK